MPRREPTQPSHTTVDFPRLIAKLRYYVRYHLEEVSRLGGRYDHPAYRHLHSLAEHVLEVVRPFEAEYTRFSKLYKANSRLSAEWNQYFGPNLHPSDIKTTLGEQRARIRQLESRVSFLQATLQETVKKSRSLTLAYDAKIDTLFHGVEMKGKDDAVFRRLAQPSPSRRRRRHR